MVLWIRIDYYADPDPVRPFVFIYLYPIVVLIFNVFVIGLSLMFAIFLRTAGWSDHRVPGRVHQQGGAGDDCRLTGGFSQVKSTTCPVLRSRNRPFFHF